MQVIDNHIMLSELTVCDPKDMNDEAREAALSDHMNTAIALVVAIFARYGSGVKLIQFSVWCSTNEGTDWKAS